MKKTISILALSVAMAAPLGFQAVAATAAAPAATAPKAKPHKPVGLPDWSGVWTEGEANLFNPKDEKLTGYEAQYFGSDREYPPYNAEWEAKYQHELDLNKKGEPRDPTAACVPPGMPRLMSSPYPWEFIVQKGRVTMLKEYQSQVRRIYTDGRGHPDDPDPSYNGDSIGHWEGQTLVIDTIAMRGDTLYDRTGAPHSDKIRVTERMRLIDHNTIENILTLDDPVAFTHPWVVRRTYVRKPDWVMAEYVCTENNRNEIDANGVTTVKLK